jgi:hypothetical protein
LLVKIVPDRSFIYLCLVESVSCVCETFEVTHVHLAPEQRHVLVCIDQVFKLVFVTDVKHVGHKGNREVELFFFVLRHLQKPVELSKMKINVSLDFLRLLYELIVGSMSSMSSRNL